MKLREHIDKLKFDSRMTDINLKAGRLTKEEMDKYLSSLPDSAAQAETLKLEDEKSNGSYPSNQFDQ